MTTQEYESGIPHLTVEDTHKRRSSGDITLIDVRTQEEWGQTGVPAGAHRATLQDTDFVQQIESIAKASGDKPIAFTCALGGRSLQAAIIAHQHGMETVFNVDGGFAAWDAANLPVDPA
ncbi:MAG: rhodanese-like domain-containing protein [Pseudomonadota bacterium]